MAKKLYTATQAAEIIGCGHSTVARICRKLRASGTEIGIRTVDSPGSAWLLTEAEIKRIAKLVQKGPGNPTMRSGTAEERHELAMQGASSRRGPLLAPKIAKLLDSGKTPAEVVKRLGCSLSHVYRVSRDREK